jgi:hypothetical protein
MCEASTGAWAAESMMPAKVTMLSPRELPVLVLAPALVLALALGRVVIAMPPLVLAVAPDPVAAMPVRALPRLPADVRELLLTGPAEAEAAVAAAAELGTVAILATLCRSPAETEDDILEAEAEAAAVEEAAEAAGKVMAVDSLREAAERAASLAAADMGADRDTGRDAGAG